MFRRSGKAIERFQEARQQRKDEKEARANVTNNKKTNKTGGKAAAVQASSKSKSSKSKSKSTTKDKSNAETDEFLEWRANEKRKENITKKKLNRRNPVRNNKEKISCREMMKEPEAHTLVALVLTLHLLFHFFVTWRNAAMSKESGLPEAARQDVVNSQGLQLVTNVGHWISIFAVFCYFVEQILTLFFDGITVYFTSSRVLDFLLWSVASVLAFYGAAHSPLFNIPRLVWRIYIICSTYLERATTSTSYYRNKVIKLNTLAKSQRKTMVDMVEVEKTLKKEIEQHKNHISELERSLLIAAESVVNRMDLNSQEFDSLDRVGRETL